MKKRYQAATFILIGTMMCSNIVSADTESSLQEPILETAQTLKEMEADGMGDWSAIALAFSGVAADYESCLKELEETLDLEEALATDYHRIALAVTALGGDPTSFGGVDLIAQGTYDYEGDLGTQGTNAYIYALLTLDSKDYEIPEDASYTREMIIEEILQAQSQEGGFAMVGNSGSDIDITAMALQALAPYQSLEEVQSASENALDWLSGEMSQYGTFVNAYGEESCESSAQTLMALGALGIDPQTDERFQKDGCTLLDGMNQFRMEDGSYTHSLEEMESNVMATQQALLALEATELAAQGSHRLLDMTDYTVPESEGSIGVLPIVIAAVVVVAVGVGVTVGMKKKKQRTGKE